MNAIAKLEQLSIDELERRNRAALNEVMKIRNTLSDMRAALNKELCKPISDGKVVSKALAQIEMTEQKHSKATLEMNNVSAALTIKSIETGIYT